MSERLRFLIGDERHRALACERRGHVGELRRRLLDTPWSRSHAHVAVLLGDGERVLASVLVEELHYRLDFQRLRLAGLGTPHVVEGRRRRGLDRFFLKAVHDRLSDEGFDGAVCFAAPQARWPERHGYQALPLATLVADLRGFMDDERLGVSDSLVRAWRESDFEPVRQLYNAATCVQRLAVLRDDALWRHELERARLERAASTHELPLDFVVGEREGRVVSYLRAARDPLGGALVVLEYGFEVGMRDDVAALLRGVLEPLGPRRPATLRGVAPSRLANLVPARRLSWRRQARPRMLMRSFGSFEVPTDAPPDERLVWQADFLAPAGAVTGLVA
jgi:hypothetical protein